MSQYPPPGQYGEQYPSPPPGGYPQQPGGYSPPPPGGGQQYWQESPKGKGMAITAMVLGIIALPAILTVVGGILLGLVAAILGLIAIVKIRGGRAGGMGMAITGVVLGIIGIIGSVIWGLIIWTAAEETGFTDYIDCAQKAGSDQAKLDQCEREFNRRVEDKFSVTLTPQPTP
ncbi:DUF4190 domain-containing protein [Nocardia huaxiensis]|uniref:DUF4190 domain-containing protein n=1 Tax=Nocardia huaxiensis TaxID=2755382 RepID=A0A7D6VEL0_9NOCA|nr:DUF4190 domain-containing protein [Nocardia huaxiensis]QLY31037.1 DUF4190 domain-containing protein [Nocardia huaxiensis]